MIHTCLQVRLDAMDATCDDVFGLVRADGFGGIEWCGALEEVIGFENSQARRRAVEFAQSHHLALETTFLIERFDAGHLGDNDADARRDAINDTLRLMRVARAVGAGRISIAPAVVTAQGGGAVRYQDALNRVFEGLPLLCREAERNGVTLCLCASQNGFLMSPPEMRELIDGAHTPALGVDISMTRRDDQADWRDWVSTLGPRLRAVGVPHSSGDDLIEDVARACAESNATNARIVIRKE